MIKNKNLAYKVLWGVTTCTSKFNYEKYLPIENKPGPWLPLIENIKLCEVGYHLTLEPHKWEGNRVFLCEYKGKTEGDADKFVVSTFRFLKEITITNCIDPHIFVRIAYLCHVDLRGVDLSWVDLSWTNLHGANLQGANLAEADLRGANLSGANLEGANLRGANLFMAELGLADLKEADFSEADLEKASLVGADLRRANFQEADLTEANFEYANLSGANFSKAHLREANFRRAHLPDQNIDDLRKRGAII
jgi:hypothetical protein